MSIRSILQRCAALGVVLALCSAVACRADWAQAESPDFPLDTTIPEPGLMALGVLGTVAWWARKKTLLCIAGIAVLLWGTSRAGRVVVTNVTAQRHENYPVVDIRYDLWNPSSGLHTVRIEISTNQGVSYLSGVTNFTGAVGSGITTGEQKGVTWYARLDLPNVTGVLTRVRVTAWDDDSYLIVDLSGGPEAGSYPYYYSGWMPEFTGIVFKTSKMVLRRIPPGTFTMGSPGNELGRWPDEPQHAVTLTQAFYIGIYEVTQGQYSNVVGSNPSFYNQGAHAPTRPVERVSWETARGGTWPGGTAHANTFIGMLRSKTGLGFDLPTEAQWEYACRAGTTQALNNDTNLTNEYSDGNMNIVGRYLYNGGINYNTDPVNGAHAAVGSYLPNQWGLYDMHGNVWEWCLDWYSLYGGAATNPVGPATGSYGRIERGGAWHDLAKYCRSAIRNHCEVNDAANVRGFRVIVPARQ